MAYNTQEIRVPLIEDDAGDALLVQEMLAEIATPSFSITHADRLALRLDK